MRRAETHETVNVDDDNVINSDLLNLKIVLRLGSFKLKEDCQIVVETDSDDARGQIENLSHKIASLKPLNITPISFNKKIGQIIAQSLIMPQMSNLYSELFSFNGAEFYSVESEQEIEEYMRTHCDSIPVHKDGNMFVIAEDELACTKVRAAEYTHVRAFTKSEEPVNLSQSIYIIGDNSKTEFILQSLERSQQFSGINFTFKHYGKYKR